MLAHKMKIILALLSLSAAFSLTSCIVAIDLGSSPDSKEESKSEKEEK